MKKLIIMFLAVILVVQAGAFTVFADDSQEDEKPTITISNIYELQDSGEIDESSVKLQSEDIPTQKLTIVDNEVTAEDIFVISRENVEITGGRYSFRLVIRSDRTLTFDNDLEILYQGINGKYKLHYEIDENNSHIMVVSGTFENIIISSPLMEKLPSKLREKILSKVSEDTYLYRLFLNTDLGFTFHNMLSYLVDGQKHGYSIDYKYDKVSGEQTLEINEIKDEDGSDVAVIELTETKSENNSGKETIVLSEPKDEDHKTENTLIKTKANNTLKLKGRTVTVKYSSLKKGSQKLKAARVFRLIKKGQGAVSFVKKSGNKKIRIDKKTGKVTLKKGLKKNTYKVTVGVKAAGNDEYKASSTKNVTFTIKVR